MTKPIQTIVLTAALTVCLFTHAAFAQDECSTAVTAVIGANAFDTTNATSSPEPVDETQCAGTYLDWGSANKDVWFRYTAPESGVLDLTTCAPGSFDTSMVVYAGSCGALTQIACNGDGVESDACQPWYSRISDIETSAGVTYYVRIGGWNGGSSVVAGSGILSVSFQPVAQGCLGVKGDCADPHATGGCDDPACCSIVCSIAPFCCDAAWSADCVEFAVSLCGIFAYECPQPNPAVANDCATDAELLATDTFRDIDTNGCNTDGPWHAGATCDSGNDVLFNDVWYRFQAQANGTMTIQTCVVDGGPATTFDTKIAIYDMGVDFTTFDYDDLGDALVGCNDDDGTCLGAGGVYPSSLTVSALDGRWYLIRVGSYDIPGTARVTFDFPDPCVLPTANGFEAEPCGSNTNGGCDIDGSVEPISAGRTVQGTFWINEDGHGGILRDLDWYQLDVTEDREVTISLYSRSFTELYLIRGDLSVPGCGGISLVDRGDGDCPNRTVICLSAGTYYVVAGLDFESALAPCGSSTRNDYVLDIQSVPAPCPALIEPQCVSAGPDVAWSNNQVPPTGTNNLGAVVACAQGGAYPSCGVTGTAANKFARVFTAGQLGGDIDCLELGFFSIKRGNSTVGSSCVNYLSDIPLPALVSICRDTDGGAPRNIIASAGDGNDLEILATREIIVPGMADTGALDLDPPLCLEGVSGNIVVVLEVPSFIEPNPLVPEDSGYGLRAAGLTVAGQPSQVFVRLSCADAAGQFIPAENLSSTFTAQWFVGAHGTFSRCPSLCPADCTRDGVVDSGDLAALLSAWGQPDSGQGPNYPDVDGDGVVGAFDLTRILDAWGPCP